MPLRAVISREDVTTREALGVVEPKEPAGSRSRVHRNRYEPSYANED